MAITFIGVSTSQAGTATTPAGVQVGDLLVGCAFNGQGVGSHQTALETGGWTHIDYQAQTTVQSIDLAAAIYAGSGLSISSGNFKAVWAYRADTPFDADFAGLVQKRKGIASDPVSLGAWTLNDLVREALEIYIVGSTSDEVQGVRFGVATANHNERWDSNGFTNWGAAGFDVIPPNTDATEVYSDQTYQNPVNSQIYINAIFYAELPKRNWGWGRIPIG